MIHSLFARRLLRACGLLLVLAALAACGSSVLSNPQAFQVQAGGDEGNGEARVGERFYFGITGFGALGAEPVTLTSATALSVPSGLDVEVRAAHFDSSMSEIRFRYIGGERDASIRSEFPRLVLYPVSDVSFVKGRRPDWYLVVIMTGHRVGNFSIPGIEVQGRLGSTAFRSTVKYKMSIYTIDPHARIDMSKPLDLIADCPGWGDPAPRVWQQLADRAVHDGGGAAVVHVLAQPSPIWNTPDGHRPTQREVDAGAVPRIYTPLLAQVVRSVSGASPPAGSSLTALILGGGIGQDSVGGCNLTIDQPKAGNTYLVVFGPSVTGVDDAATARPVLQFRSIAIMNGNEADTAFGPVQVP